MTTRTTPPPPPPPEPRVLRAHEAGVQALAFLDAAGQRLVSGDADGIVKLWDLASCRPRLSFPTPTGPAPTSGAPPFQGVLSLHPLGGQHQLLAQLRGGALMTYDIGEADARPVGGPIQTGAYHFCRAARPRGGGESPLVLSPCADSGSFGLWDVRAAAAAGGGGPSMVFKPPPAGDGEGGSAAAKTAAALAGDAGGRGLCMALHLMLPEQGSGSGGEGSGGGGYALAAFEDGSVHAFDLRMAGKGAACGAKLLTETALSMDVGPSGQYGVLGSAGSELVVFGLDLAEHRITVAQRVALARPGVADVQVRPDEQLFVSGGWDRRVRAFQLRSPGGSASSAKKRVGGPLAVLRCHAESVQCLAFPPPPPSRDGGVGVVGSRMPLASGGKDARIALWDLYPPDG